MHSLRGQPLREKVLVLFYLRTGLEVAMKIVIASALAIALGLGAASAAQTADSTESHLAAAKAAAGFDFTGTLARVCIAPQTAAGRDVAPGSAPDRSTYIADPAKVFDNL